MGDNIMRGNYLRPSELLKLQRETGKSYWDLIGRPLYDDGKDIEEAPVQEVEDVNVRAALDYAISLKLDNDAQTSFNTGKDVAGSYNFNAIPLISLNAGMSYGDYYDKLTGDLFMDANRKIPTYKKGKSEYTDASDLITHYEGFVDSVYQNKNDVPITMYGITEQRWIDYAKKKGKVTLAEGKRAVFEHLRDTVIPSLSKNIPGYADMPEKAQWVLQDILYNVGTGGLYNKSPKFMKAIRERNWAEAARLMDWDNNKVGYSKGARDRNAERQRLWNEAFGLTTPDIKQIVEEAPKFQPQVVKQPLQYTMTPKQAQYVPAVPEYINKDAGVATWPRTTALPDIIDEYNKLWLDSPVLKPVWRTE